MTLLSDVPSVSPRAEGLSSRDDEAFVIETADAAAGVILREAGGYRFFAANDRFRSLDGSLFKTPKAAQKAAEMVRRAAMGAALPELPWS